MNRENGSSFTYRSIYILFKKKLGIFQKYLEKNLKSEFIKKFQLLVVYTIFFLYLKKNIYILITY